MDADWSVELDADDPALELPWTSPDGSQQYIDLLLHPELINQIPEAERYPPLRLLLVVLNANNSPWQTAKCDVWLDDESGDAVGGEGRRQRVCSYADVIRRDTAQRFSFTQHEACVKEAVARLQPLGDDSIACELVVRRCYFHMDPERADDSEPGFCVTIYVIAQGSGEAEAFAGWSQGLSLVASALVE
jgi:hypothetical protein